MNSQTGDGIDDVISEYVSGALSYPAQILVESHLDLTPENHELVGEMEALAGLHLEENEPTDLSDAEGMLGNVLKAVESIPMDEAPASLEGAVADACFPQPLRRYIGMGIDDIPWRMKAPGIKVHMIEKSDEIEAYLLRIRPGKTVPNHSHDGREMTLVLKGAFRDENGLFARGDVSVADEAFDHKPVTELGEECICFVVNTGPVRFSHPLTRIISTILPN